MDPRDQVFAHTSEDMREVPDGAVALTVTSPPYHNAIDYVQHVADSAVNYRTRRREQAYPEYLAFLKRVFAEVHRVTKPGGFCAVVVGTVLDGGEHIALPHHLTTLLEGIGWRFHQDILWHKVTAGVRRAGVVIQKPFPGYYYPNLMTEYILVFRKDGPSIFKGRTTVEREASRIAIDSVFTHDVANTLWNIPPVPPGSVDHPCPFPEEIPHRLITLYSYPGELVLDPFCGAGTTLKVARHLGRGFVGFEVQERYAVAARKAVDAPSRLRPSQIVLEYGKVPWGATIAAKNPKQRRRRPPVT